MLCMDEVTDGLFCVVGYHYIIFLSVFLVN